MASSVFFNPLGSFDNKASGMSREPKPFAGGCKHRVKKEKKKKMFSGKSVHLFGNVSFWAAWNQDLKETQGWAQGWAGVPVSKH